jgi:hypothetical protein
MAITIQCPNPECRARASVAEVVSGRDVKCKRCGTAFVAQPTLIGNPADTQANRPAAAANDPFPTLPAEFGRYRVLQLLGKGGMGAVYLAEDSQLGRRVALKLPSFGAGDSPERVERFLREARSAAALHHPNICTLYDAGREGDRPYLTMAYLEGRSQAEALDPDRPLPPRQAAELARKVAAALGHAHERGIVHRDLKPANVMLSAAGEPVVMDFGLAKRLAEADAGAAKLTRVGAVMGTPDYMAPEQVRGETDRIGPPTDIYALGVLLFELLTGRPPYEGHVGAVLGQILAAPVPSVQELRPDIDERLEAICRQAMAKEPGARFPSMASFAEALGQYLALAGNAQPAASQGPEPFRDLTQPAPKRRSRARAAAGPSRRPLLIGAGAGLVLLLAALGVVLLTVRTKHGDVVVELSDPAAPVEVKVDGEKIELAGLDRPVSLTAGEHGLTVTGADYEIVTQTFTVKKGEKQVVKVMLTPKPVAGGGPGKAPTGGPGAPAVPASLAGRFAPLREKMLRDGGGTEESEAAVARGLGWIVRQQRGDGSWSFAGYDPDHGTDPSAPAATGLALLPLLGAGHTHKAGDFVAQVDKGIKYLLNTQPADGGFSGNAYHQGIPTIALCEAYALTKDERLKEPAQRALDFIVKAQHAGGGWRYERGQAGDTSCTGWALVALKTGQLAGLAVPDDALRRVSRFLDDMEYPDDSGYGYEVRTKGGPATSAIGLLCRLHLGWGPRDPRVLKGVEVLAKEPPSPSLHNVYYCYYATQVMRHVGGAAWKDWDPRMRSWLLAGQSPGPLGPDKKHRAVGSHGSWSPVGDVLGKAGGRLMTTSLALLTLEVYYRHVPYCDAELGDGPIAARPNQPAAKPELVVLRELPREQHKSGPWPSPDGLTLYWSSKSGKDFRVWVATRKDKDSPFANVKDPLFAGYDLTVTADGREMILVDGDGPGLSVSTRASPKDQWSRPRKLEEFDGLGFLAAPCVSGDGLTLYAEQFANKDLAHNVCFRRPDRKSAWGKPEAMTITGLSEDQKPVRFPFVTDDGRYLFACARDYGSGMLLFTSTDGGKTFGSPAVIDVPGGTVPGKFPRYVPATNELFFCETVPDQGRNNIYVIRNFDPGSTIRALK